MSFLNLPKRSWPKRASFGKTSIFLALILNTRTRYMPARKPTRLQELRTAIDRANAEGNDALAAELSQVRHAVRTKADPLALVPLLETSTSYITKAFVAEVLGAAGDVRVLQPLMRAAAHPANVRHTSWFLLACARYDCSAHLAFFVRFLLTARRPTKAWCRLWK
ncbi:hypothetical protein [Hymenobacter amundsenii]|nr:hypothetical protein [Hymenobacter amundsenii]